MLTCASASSCVAAAAKWPMARFMSFLLSTRPSRQMMPKPLWLSLSPYSAPRSNHIFAITASCFTPSPRRYIRPRYPAAGAA